MDHVDVGVEREVDVDAGEGGSPAGSDELLGNKYYIYWVTNNTVYIF